MSAPDPLESMRRNRPLDSCGISGGVVNHPRRAPETLQVPWRYLWLLLGGAVGAGLGWLVRLYLDLPPESISGPSLRPRAACIVPPPPAPSRHVPARPTRSTSN